MDASYPRDKSPGIAVGTTVLVSDGQRGIVVANDVEVMGRDDLLYVVELRHGFWCVEANGRGSAAAFEARTGMGADAFVSLLVCHEDSLEVTA